MPNAEERQRLSPLQVATRQFGLAPDRDERAPQLCQEALLTLALNGYEQAGGEELAKPPKRERFALRSLALGANFLAGRDTGRAGDEETTPQLYGQRLAKGEDMRGSAELGLIREALEGLIDPDTRKGQPGGWLLFPFHESLLWYDARRQGSNGRWGVRRVWMRGSGITIARMLANPPPGTDGAELGQAAVRALRDVLQASSPLADIAEQLERPLGAEDGSQRLETAESEAWRLGGEQRVAPLAGRLCRDAEGILRQGGASGPAKLWQLRMMLGLDVAMHALKIAWETTATPAGERFLLLSFAGPPRAENRVRQRSEASFASARIRLREAILAQLASDIRRLRREGVSTWQEEFLTRRGQLRAQIEQLDHGGLSEDDIDRIAREIIDEADYERPVGGFTNLIQTAGLIAGTGQYRYLTVTPELFSALVGALSSRMPMPSDEFFDAIFVEWGLVIGQSAAARTALGREIDGALLERNARRAEQQLADSGLALALSDRTTLVGERAWRPA
jgi:hypothetical protein